MIRLRPLAADVSLRNVTMRLPFRFGVHTMTAAPLCLVRVRVEDSTGAIGEGWASDLVVPRWFEKTPGQSIVEDWQRLMDGIRTARDQLLSQQSLATVFEHWRHMYASCVMSEATETLSAKDRCDRLRRGHGPSLMERAMIDAACRLSGHPFATGVDELGIDVASCSSWLHGASHVAFHAERPVVRMHLRHTIGMVDPLTRADVAADGDPDDGLPVTLEEILEATGTRFLKIKLCGDLSKDVDRLRAIAEILRARNETLRMRITLDGNEQFESVQSLLELWEALQADELMASQYQHVLWIEQPLSRVATFDPTRHRGMKELSSWTSCIIDEADVDPGALPDAMALGYRGVSTKNCKGVFRSFLNRCVLQANDGIHSAEDLTNLPVIALQQDLATASMLGINHIERNGHHYVSGLHFLPKREQASARQRHPDLYEQVGDRLSLRISDGQLQLNTLLACVGYGHEHAVDLSEWTPLSQWDPTSVVGTESNDGAHS